eukprot:2447639-Rhodomonas_salina.3
MEDAVLEERLEQAQDALAALDPSIAACEGLVAELDARLAALEHSSSQPSLLEADLPFMAPLLPFSDTVLQYTVPVTSSAFDADFRACECAAPHPPRVLLAPEHLDTETDDASRPLVNPADQSTASGFGSEALVLEPTEANGDLGSHSGEGLKEAALPMRQSKEDSAEGQAEEEHAASGEEGGVVEKEKQAEH